MIALLYSLLLFALPLLIVPFIKFPYELPKVIAFELIFYLIVFFIGQSNSIKSIFSANKLLLLVSFGIVGISLFGLLRMPTQVAFFGNVFRLQGVFLLWHLLGLALVTASLSKFTIHWKWYGASLIGLLISAFLLTHPVTGRATGTLGESNALAAAAVLLWPISMLTYGKRGIFSPIPFLSLGAACVIVFVSQSRAGFVALIIQIIFFLSLKIIKKPIVSVILATILIGLSMLLPLIDSSSVYENRAEIWRTALQATNNNPILGSGFGNITPTLRLASVQLSNNVRFQSVDSAHNIFLDWLVQGGIVGLGLFLILAGSSFYAHLKTKNIEYAVMMIGLLVVLSFNPASVVSLVALFLLIGLGFGKKGKEKLKML
jgi:O-antigen ligase